MSIESTSFKAACRGLVLTGLAGLAGAAQASDFFCNNYVAGNPLQHYQCVQTTVGPGAPLILSPDQAGSGKLTASSTSAGSGPFASTSVANATAEPGLLRGFASAEMLGGSIDGAQAVARSDAWFADGATVVGAAGVPLGAQVKLRFTLDIAGGFAGGAPFNALSEANAELFAGILGGGNVSTRSTINKFDPFGFETVDLDARVGDSFEMLMKLHVAAGAINSGAVGNAMSIADVSNTSHLYVDVLSGNAQVVSASGHLYASRAVLPDPGPGPTPVPIPIPEPGNYALVLGGLLFIGLRLRRRRT